ncbi:MAG TPA: TIGR04283 family arsenosugar biosynthesis glycosyltransferase [Candidatus Binataceae bacterium]|nr:TIGR04283 family arsenosugar biosynthesis glycosyltransferase [Candidatus Binataceae bacterium]
MKQLSVIVPMLNEERAIARTLEALAVGAPGAEIIVVDGGSADRSIEEARPRCTTLLSAPRGRARQMNAGAAAAHGDTLAFVHADTLVPRNFARDIDAALATPTVVGGRFDVRLEDPAPLMRLIGWLISVRSRLSHTGTGDQALFVRREVFARLGGYREIELCEDLDFARRLKRAGRVACLRSCVVTSARRWHRGGVLRTVLQMWLIRAAFLMGVSPARLARLYTDAR